MSEKDKYSEVIKDLENTLNGYDEKATRKIIMEFLKKHEEDYANRKTDDDDGEYEVYSNEFVSFNDDYVPDEYEENNDYNDNDLFDNMKENTEEVSESDDYEQYYNTDTIEKAKRASKSRKKEMSQWTIAEPKKKKSERKPGIKLSDKSYFNTSDPEESQTERRKRTNSRETVHTNSTAPIIAKISCVMVVILAAVVIFLFNRLNSLDKQIAETSQPAVSVESYQAEISNLEAQVADLQGQIDNYQKAVSDLSTQETTDKAVDENIEPSNSSTDNESENNTIKTYTVVKGDNLSKISRKVYGSEKYVEDIKKANNISGDGDTLSVGVELKLPEVN